MASKTKFLAIANHKGGCGKTTVTVNLADEFARMGLKVLVVDVDPQSNASFHIGKEHPSEVPVTCAELLLGGIDQITSAIHDKTHLDGVSLIYGSLKLGRAEDELREAVARPSEELRRKLAIADGLFDVVIIDTPPSLKLLTSNGLAAATHVIIPFESPGQYGMYGVTDLLQHIEKIRVINPDLIVLGALAIKYDERQTMCRLITKAAEAEVGKLVPVKIPSSTKVTHAAAMQTGIRGIDRTAKVSREFRDLAKWVAKEMGLKLKEATNNG